MNSSFKKNILMNTLYGLLLGVIFIWAKYMDVISQAPKGFHFLKWQLRTRTSLSVKINSFKPLYATCFLSWNFWYFKKSIPHHSRRPLVYPCNCSISPIVIPYLQILQTKKTGLKLFNGDDIPIYFIYKKTPAKPVFFYSSFNLPR